MSTRNYTKDYIIFLQGSTSQQVNKSTERLRNADCFRTGGQLDTHPLFVH